MTQNIIREILEHIGMNPDGALIGAIGAIVAVIGKVNGYSWKASLAIISGGFFFSGYLLQALVDHWSLPDGILYFVLFIAGFISNHIYQFLDSYAPKFFALGGEIISRYIKKK